LDFLLTAATAPLPVPGDGGLVKRLLGAAAVARIAGRLTVGRLGCVRHLGGRVIAADGSGVGGGVGALGSGGGAGGLPLGGNLLVQLVEALGGGAVKVEPPVADEVVLVEDGAVGAEEAVLGEAALAVGGADVENLALGLGIGVVASVHLAVAAEAGLGHLGVDGIVLAGDAGNGLLQHGQVVIAAGRAGGRALSKDRDLINHNMYGWGL
jgi:hypothetical protein